MIRRRLKVRGPRIDYSVLAIKKGPSIQLEKGWKKVAFETALAKAYAIVNARDRERSRITGINLFPHTEHLKARREHNHLEPRSTAPDRITDPSNIFLVSNYEHGFITSGALIVHGKDANKEIRFSWNRNMVPAGKEPFRIPGDRQYRPGKSVAA